MNEKDLEIYTKIRSGGTGYFEQKRGLIAVWGNEAVQFLNGLITNDVAKLEEGSQMLAAFPNAQGRLIAVVNVMRTGERFLFETEEATHPALHQNLFRFTFAGDFFVEDLSLNYRYYNLVGDFDKPVDSLVFDGRGSRGVFVPNESVEAFGRSLSASGAALISKDVYEVMRIESGVPLFGIDMDESTIVPELGLDGLISYSKGCYIGQEIIARIHFRGHVAKQLQGLIVSGPSASEGTISGGTELVSPEGKSAGRITSVTFSPALEKTIALAYVRYDYLAEGTTLSASGLPVTVSGLPFVK